MRLPLAAALALVLAVSAGGARGAMHQKGRKRAHVTASGADGTPESAQAGCASGSPLGEAGAQLARANASSIPSFEGFTGLWLVSKWAGSNWTGRAAPGAYPALAAQHASAPQPAAAGACGGGGSSFDVLQEERPGFLAFLREFVTCFVFWPFTLASGGLVLGFALQAASAGR